MLRRLVFKAAIYRESFNYGLNYEIRARDAQFEIMEEPNAVDDYTEPKTLAEMRDKINDSQKFDVVRHFAIKKTIYNEIKRSGTARPSTATFAIR